MIRFLVTLADKRKVLAYANSKADFLGIRSSLARCQELPELIANALANQENQDLVQRAKTTIKRTGFASCVIK